MSYLLPPIEGRIVMSKVLFVISLMGLLACGTGESDPGTAGIASDTPPVSAVAPAAKKAEVVKIDEGAVVEGEQADVEADAAVVRSCIDLVASGDFKGALPVCLEAASIDPQNAEVQAALAKAKTEAAAGAASGAAADAATNALGGLGN